MRAHRSSGTQFNVSEDQPTMAFADGQLGDNIRSTLLGEGEALHGLITVRTKSRIPGLSGFYSGLIEIRPEPEPLSPAMTMAVAVTSRRVLVLEISGPLSSREAAKRVVAEMPLSEVQSLELDEGMNVWRVRWESRGYHYTVASSAGRAGPFAKTLRAATDR
jgi:hypothetical protein